MQVLANARNYYLQIPYLIILWVSISVGLDPLPPFALPAISMGVNFLWPYLNLSFSLPAISMPAISMGVNFLSSICFPCNFLGVNILVAKFLFQHLLGLQFVWVPFSLGAFSFLNNHYLHIPWVSFTCFFKKTSFQQRHFPSLISLAAP